MIRLSMKFLKDNAALVWQRHAGSVSTTAMNIPKGSEIYVIGEMMRGMQTRWEGITHLAASSELLNLKSKDFKEFSRMPPAQRNLFDKLDITDPNAALMKAVLFDQYYPGARQPKEER